MKVICAGAPKTGTKSIAKALRILGYDEVYDVEEAIEFGFNEWEAVFQNREPNLDKLLDTVYSKKVEAVVDAPHSYFFDKFLERWPDAKVILMVRDEDEWFTSFSNMMNEGSAAFKYMVFLRPLSKSLRRMLEWTTFLFTMTVGTPRPHELLWKVWYRRHNAYVKATVPEKQLLIYNVQEAWEPLCEFLERPVPDDDFPFENRAVTSSKKRILHRMMTDVWVVKKAQREVKRSLLLIGSGVGVGVMIGVYFAYFR